MIALGLALYAVVGLLLAWWLYQALGWTGHLMPRWVSVACVIAAGAFWPATVAAFLGLRGGARG